MGDLPKGLVDIYHRADQTGQSIPVGRIVVCDSCSEDYTDSDLPGGLIFESKGICPKLRAGLVQVDQKAQ